MLIQKGSFLQFHISFDQYAIKLEISNKKIPQKWCAKKITREM